MTNALYVYCQNPSPRIKYVFDFIRIEWNLSELIFLDQNTLLDHTAEAVINYSKEILSISSIHFIPSYIVESGKVIAPKLEEWIDELPYFFKTNPSTEGIQQYDVPGMIFYMLSRLEEYDNPKSDLLGRFEGINSFAGKNGFLKMPVVDLWLEKLARLYFQLPASNKPSPEFYLTIDIDIAWAFTNRPLWENLGGAYKELISFKWKKFASRLAVWTGSKKDPFDVYDYLEKIAKQHRPVEYFILLGDRTKLDRSFHWKNPAFNALIKKLAEYSDPGIHPSSKAAGNVSELLNEKIRLESILGHEVIKSRQHYLLLDLPETYRKLISVGIKEDYTMGFHDLPGCRAGTTKPFYWYDLNLEKTTELKIYPFYVMDVTLKNYMMLSAPEAADWMQKQKTCFQKWNLPMTLVWHNSSFFESDGWKGWKEVLEIIFPLRSQ